MPQINVTINGKNYRMACDEGQENHLLELAQKLDGYVGHLRGSFGEIGDQRLTIMAGIMVVDELNELSKKVAKLETEIAKLKLSRDKLMDNTQSKDQLTLEAIQTATKQIEAICEKLN